MNEIDINDILDMLGLDKSLYHRRFGKQAKYKSYIAFVLSHIYKIKLQKVGKIMKLDHTTIMYHRDRILDLYDLNLKFGMYEEEMQEIERIVKVIESYQEFKKELQVYEDLKRFEILKKVNNEL